MASLGNFIEVLSGGLLAGVLYSLVALGFVLIFKASGVFNFAQGSMVLLAGLALVRAADNNDIELLLSCSMVAVVVVLLTKLISDVGYVYLNPRMLVT